MELITVKDVKAELGIGINQAYRLVQSDGFPKIMLNHKCLIPREEFEKWLKSYVGKQYNY